MGTYKVCILAAGSGTRMGDFTKVLNKALIPVKGKPAISHIIEKVPEDIEIVIAVGYKKEGIITYINAAYPKRKITFVEIDNFNGPGSGPGYSLLCCKEHLQCPFIYESADTLFREEIVAPDQNWFGVAEVEDTQRFCSAKEENGMVVKIDDKVKSDNKHAFIGLAGIKDYTHFWQALESNDALIDNEVQASNGFSSLIEKGMSIKTFTWFDVGIPSAYAYALEHFPDGKGYQG